MSIFDDIDIFNSTTESTLVDKMLSSIKTTENDFVSKDDIPETLYVLSFRLGFRPDGFMNMLSNSYNTKIVIMSDENFPDFYKPQGFIIDISDEIKNISVQQILLYAQEKALEYDVPIFIIGEPELLSMALNIFTNDVKLEHFVRPLDIRECVNTVKKVLEHEIEIQNHKNILIVDDSKVFLKLTKKILSSKYKVITVSTAAECIKYLANNTPDLILMDYQMPICDGSVLCKMIKKDNPGIPIIFYTNTAEPEQIIKIMPIIDGYILKNQPGNDILSHIDEFFKKQEENSLY